MDDYTIDEQGRIIVRNDPGSFIGLADTPAAYAGNANKVLYVNATPDAVAFASSMYWDEVSDRLGLGTNAPQVIVHIKEAGAAGARVWIESDQAGAPSLSNTMPGLQLSASGMNVTNQYTPAIKFMSTDSAFVTENPKLLAMIVGRATEAYGADTDGGMALDFAVTPDNPGAANVPVVKMTLDQDGNAGFNVSTVSRRTHAMDDDVATDAIVPVSRIESQVSGGAGAAGHGPGFEYSGETSTTENTLMALTAARWSTATHASRRSRFEIRTYYIANEILSGVIEGPLTSSVDGNARGGGAVDLQGYRLNATEVASGNYSAIIGGGANTASGISSFIGGGLSNNVSGNYSVAVGNSNTVPGNYSIAVCDNNTADGDYSFAGGRQADTNGNDGVFIWADSIAVAFTADRANQFKVRANGGVVFVITSSSAALPVAEFNQADVDEPFHKFVGDAAAANLTRDLVDEGDVTTATRVGWYKVEILDDGNQIVDGDYYVPFYSLS